MSSGCCSEKWIKLLYVHLLYSYLQDLQRRLDLERAERNKADSATLKLLSELKEDSQKANELRDQESRLT